MLIDIGIFMLGGALGVLFMALVIAGAQGDDRDD